MLNLYKIFKRSPSKKKQQQKKIKQIKAAKLTLQNNRDAGVGVNCKREENEDENENEDLDKDLKEKLRITAKVAATASASSIGDGNSQNIVKPSKGVSESALISKKSQPVKEVEVEYEKYNFNELKKELTKQEQEQKEREEETIKKRTGGRFVDENCYDTSHAKRGTALIISNKEFNSELELSDRNGADKDAEALENALFKLGFNVITGRNCTKQFMLDQIKKQAEADHSDADCFLCCVMSHGDTDGVVYGTDGELNVDQLMRPFRLSRSLVGKPKLFFIQACRGTQLMDGIDSSPFDAANAMSRCVSHIPMEADFLIAYSTIAGYFSWRNTQNGSWFIQSFCQVLEEETSAQLDFLSLLTRVNRRVAYYFASSTNDESMNNKRQVPSIVSMLTKDLYFRPKLPVKRVRKQTTTTKNFTSNSTATAITATASIYSATSASHSTSKATRTTYA